MKVYIINAFGKTEIGGNPAGVVLESKNLNEDQMRNIASKVGFSETAFVTESDCADFKIRFFTPKEEVDLCGHATIATFIVLKEIKKLKSGIYTQETKAGILEVELKDDGTVFMNQNTPQFYGVLDKKEIADSLNIKIEDFLELPVEIVSTGLKDIIIPIKKLNILKNIKPNFEKISEISNKNNVTGYHVFSLETLLGSAAHCRNFAPLYGINEESATGTSSGALACYLYKYKKIIKSNLKKILFEQGYSMGLPSEIVVSLKEKDNKVIEVKIGGKATNLKEIEI